MELAILIPILIHSVTLLIAIAALIVARGAYNTSPRVAIRELLEIMADYETRQDRLEGKWKKLNANYASLRAESRGATKDHNEEESLDTDRRPGESYEQHKARLRGMLRQGRFQHGPDAYPGGS